MTGRLRDEFVSWHGKFKKEWPTEEEKKHIGKNGILNL